MIQLVIKFSGGIMRKYIAIIMSVCFVFCFASGCQTKNVKNEEKVTDEENNNDNVGNADGIVLPSYLEKSKYQRDISTLEEMAHSFVMVMANECYAKVEGQLIFRGGTIAINGDREMSDKLIDSISSGGRSVDDFFDEFSATMDGNSSDPFVYEFKSKLNDENTVVTFTFKDGKVSIEIKSEKYGNIEI